MLCSQLCYRAHNIGTAVRCQSTGNHLECTGKRLVGPLLDAWNGLSLLHKAASKLHLKRSTTWDHLRV
jgi:hypothetical protein